MTKLVGIYPLQKVYPGTPLIEYVPNISKNTFHNQDMICRYIYYLYRMYIQHF